MLPDAFLIELRERALAHNESTAIKTRVNLVDESNAVIHALGMDEDGQLVGFESMHESHAGQAEHLAAEQRGAE